MTGIPADQWMKTKPEDRRAMEANYAETFSVPAHRVGWRVRNKRGRRLYFLCLKPARKLSGWAEAEVADLADAYSLSQYHAAQSLLDRLLEGEYGELANRERADAIKQLRNYLAA